VLRYPRVQIPICSQAFFFFNLRFDTKAIGHRVAPRFENYTFANYMLRPGIKERLALYTYCVTFADLSVNALLQFTNLPQDANSARSLLVPKC
jgi:hypothetical protein